MVNCLTITIANIRIFTICTIINVCISPYICLITICFIIDFIHPTQLICTISCYILNLICKIVSHTWTSFYTNIFIIHFITILIHLILLTCTSLCIQIVVGFSTDSISLCIQIMYIIVCFPTCSTYLQIRIICIIINFSFCYINLRIQIVFGLFLLVPPICKSKLFIFLLVSLFVSLAYVSKLFMTSLFASIACAFRLFVYYWLSHLLL